MIDEEEECDVEEERDKEEGCDMMDEHNVKV